MGKHRSVLWKTVEMEAIMVVLIVVFLIALEADLVGYVA